MALQQSIRSILGDEDAPLEVQVQRLRTVVELLIEGAAVRSQVNERRFKHLEKQYFDFIRVPDAQEKR